MTAHRKLVLGVAFTVLALRLEVRCFWHGRVAFNHKAQRRRSSKSKLKR